MSHISALPITFAGFPAHDDAASPAAQIAVIGVPYLSPYPGKKSYDCLNAVSSIRQASLTYQKLDHFDFDFDGPLLGSPPVHCTDYGNIVRESESFDDYSQSITRAVRDLLTRGTVPVVIGGDHGTTIPVLRAYETIEDLCVVQIDAHLDWVDERDGVSEGFSSPMRRASEMPYVSSVVQIGLRGQGSARQKEADDAAACSKCLLIKAEDLHEQGVTEVLKRIPNVRHYYFTVDADGFDPSIAPGVAYPTPGGVTYYQLFNLMRGLAGKGVLMGMDFVEVVPENDVANMTSMFAARQILNFMGVAAHSGQFSGRRSVRPA
ncbi:MAG: arginase family protein [Deltaproteobacteria bacterium]|nr:arginase family protein [Deltaproteobacteria bacterium]